MTIIDGSRSRPARLRLLLAVLAAFLIIGTSAAPAALAQDQAGDNNDDSALLDLVGCLNGSHHLAVVFLFDESGSLQFTDPDGRRVDAALTALDSLAVLGDGAGDDKLTVDVTIGTFADIYRPESEWLTLDAETRPLIRESMESLRTRDDGRETDLIKAFEGARDALATRSAEVTVDGGAAPCKAILTFTDGAEYKLQPRTPENTEVLGTTKDYAPGADLRTEGGIAEAETAGREAMCSEGGLADEIRDDDISLITVSLLAGDQVSDADFLPAISTGSSGSLTCGKASGTATGTYLVASDIDTLITRFDEIATRLGGGTLVATDDPAPVLCDGNCDEGTRTLEVNSTIRRLRVLALAAEPGMVLKVEGPGDSVEIDGPGNITVGGAKGTVSVVAGRGYSVSIDRPDDEGDWNGTWKFVTVAGSDEQIDEPAVVQVYVFSDIGVALAGDLDLTRGAEAEIEAVTIAPEGIDTAELFAAPPTVQARLDDPVTKESWTVALEGPVEGPFKGTFAVPADVRTNAFDLSIVLTATTREGASVLARSSSTEVLVRRPEGSVQFAPPSLVFPTLTGEGSTSADLILVGGDGPGCVWFDPAIIDGPDEAGIMTVSYDGREAISEESCIQVSASETITVDVNIDPEFRGTGSIRGRLIVHESVEGGQATVTDVLFRSDLARGIDQARRLVLAAALIVGGLALPMLLLFAINTFGARFQDLDAVRAAVLPVRVRGTHLERTDGRTLPLSFHSGDFTSLSGTGDSKRFVVGGVEFRAKASHNPFGATQALAAPEGGAEKLKGGAGRKVELDPSLAGSWVFLLDPDGTRRAGPGTAEGNLIAFVAEGDVLSQVERLMPDLRKRLPGIASGLADLVREKVVKVKAPEARGGEPEGLEPSS
ncbi:MAG: VWA domain-containing protein [Aquihabitans sp.]